MTSTLLDSYASFAPSLRAPGSPQAALYSIGSHAEVMSTGSDLGIEGEVVDLAAEMVPTFFESGQLMWEMSARTERISNEEEPSMMRPEIVLTDSSFLSVSVIQEDLVSQEDFERAQDSRNDAEDEQDNFDQREKQVLSGQHCFELLTDEDGPLCENVSDVDDEFQKAEIDGIDAKPKLNETNNAQVETSTSSSNDLSASSFPSDTLSCPVHSAIDDCDWMERQYGNKINQGRTTNNQGMKEVKTYLMDSAPSLMLPSSKKTESLTLSDSASDLFATYDLDLRMGEFHSTPMRKRVSSLRPPQQHRPPLMPSNSLPAGYFDIGRHVTGLHIRRQCRSSPENSPRAHKPPGCSLKDVFSSAMCKFNEVLYNCTHAKQRRQEKKILKKLQARSNGNITPSSSAAGAYRRRHTFICQKMEGMINNESKLKSTKRLPRSRTSSLAGVRRTAGASSGV